MNEGKLIVIEGQDGTGKETQARRLVDHMLWSGKPAMYMRFPRYGQPSAWLVERYLAQDNTLDRSPKAASLYYLVDRLNAAAEIRRTLASGISVIADRYTASNAGHQGARITDPEERVAFFHWLWELEFSAFGIPKPAINVLLSMPFELSIELMRKRSRTADAHERDAAHLAAAAESYQQVVGTFPDEFLVIECSQQGKIFSPEAIHVNVWDRLESYLS